MRPLGNTVLAFALFALAACPGPHSNTPAPEAAVPADSSIGNGADLAPPADFAGLTACPSDGGLAHIDPNTDPSNCGACGQRCCIVTVCSSGRCVGDCNPGMQMCAAPMPGCLGGFYCADTLTDPNNCGGCGRKCGQGTICQGGICK